MSYSTDNSWVYTSTNYANSPSLNSNTSDINVGVIDVGVSNTQSNISSKLNITLSKDYTNNYNEQPFIDSISHGTPVASLISGTNNSNYNFHGFYEFAKIVSLKVMSSGSENSSIVSERIANAINYAEANNIKVLNISLADNYYSDDVLASMQNYSGIIVCGAGNESQLITSSNPVFMSSYVDHSIQNIISVGGITNTDSFYSLSNYGNRVNICAPAYDLCLPNNSNSFWAGFEGTSYAAPIVTALVANIINECPNLTMLQIKNLILRTGTIKSWLNGKCSSKSVVNYFNTLFECINHSHVYNYSYEQYDGTKHRAYCKCGYSTLKNHVVSNPRTMICDHCGAICDLGYVITDGYEEEE